MKPSFQMGHDPARGEQAGEDAHHRQQDAHEGLEAPTGGNPEETRTRPETERS